MVAVGIKLMTSQISNKTFKLCTYTHVFSQNEVGVR